MEKKLALDTKFPGNHQFSVTFPGVVNLFNIIYNKMKEIVDKLNDHSAELKGLKQRLAALEKPEETKTFAEFSNLKC
jgi:hypothetical protein